MSVITNHGQYKDRSSFCLAVEPSSAFLVQLIALLRSILHGCLPLHDLLHFLADEFPVLKDGERGILFYTIADQICNKLDLNHMQKNC